MDIFKQCHIINDNIIADNHKEARDELIKLLDYLNHNKIIYSPLVNNLIRQTGLYPYLKTETASWSDRFIYEAFKVDVGHEAPITLHREQSELLKSLLEGKNIAISAPTSFGKSFVVDSFIALKKPKTVVIIVPTIALTDETRRRIYRKFSDKYKIITTTECELEEYNILIFPQERAINYIDKLTEIDILIIDEFYKASSKYEKDRSPALINAIIQLGVISKQKYFLAPNIKEFISNELTEDIEFIEKLDFNTVYLQKFNVYNTINNEKEKSTELIKILNAHPSKTLIYAANYSQIDKVAELINNEFNKFDSKLNLLFADWLIENYDKNWKLANLIQKGFGIHNGSLHRALSQIQIKLFEEENGLSGLISTSSIIEGVNTSAENIIIWKNSKGGQGNPKLDSFTYKNIIGRGGRMFKYFIGKVFLLEEPPEETPPQLEITFPDTAISGLDEEKYFNQISDEQFQKIKTHKIEMNTILGSDSIYKNMIAENSIQGSNSNTLKNIAIAMQNQNSDWKDIGHLNSDNPDHWTRTLYKLIKLERQGWGGKYKTIVEFTKILSQNWEKTIPELLDDLSPFNVSINEFFKLERKVTFKLSSIAAAVNSFHKKMYSNNDDINPFVSKLSYAFLPPVVYQLEEYGLPRMISRKIHKAGLLDFNSKELNIHSVIDQLHRISKERIFEIDTIGEFDKYIIDYFYEGITVNKDNIKKMN